MGSDSFIIENDWILKLFYFNSAISTSIFDELILECLTLAVFVFMIGQNYLAVLTMLFNIGQINLTLLVFDNIYEKPLLSLKQGTWSDKAAWLQLRKLNLVVNSAFTF